MKAKVLPLLLALPLFAGCYVGDGGYVREEPPMAPAVVVEARSGYLWIDGHYYWDSGRYLWADGFWEVERPGYVFVQGGWVHGPRGYVWRQGYWNQSRGAGGMWNDAQRREGRGGTVYNGGAARTVVPAQGRTVYGGGTSGGTRVVPARPAAPAPTRSAPARGNNGGGTVRVHDHTK